MIKVLLIIFIIGLPVGYTFSDTLSHTVKLSLNKSEYTEGEEILLKAEFDINKSDSLESCTQSNFFMGIIVTDELGKCYRNIDYFLSRLGRVIFPEVILPPHKMLVMEAHLNRDFCFDIWKYNSKDTSTIPVGKYTLSFENRYIACWKSVSVNTLTFSVLPKN